MSNGHGEIDREYALGNGRVDLKPRDHLTTKTYVITIITLKLLGELMQAKLIDIGNSKGLRIPKNLINKYHLQEKLNLEEKADGILIRADVPVNKLSWEGTYRDMGKSNEDWSDWDLIAADGIEL